MSTKTNVLRNEKLIGGYIPQQLYEHFGLIVLHANTSRSRMLKEAIEGYVKSSPDERTMVANVAVRIYKSWLKQTTEATHPEPFRIYMNRVRDGLSKRKISKRYILAIVRGIRVLYEKEKKRSRTANPQ